MREILFRGKLLDGNWSEGNVEIKTNGVYIITPDETVIGRYGRVIPETVGQYTGLTDKNGKKIFEGDVVKVESLLYGSPFFEGKVGKVVYAECSYFVEPENPMESEYLFADECADIEIIGNIHDNPELMKEGAEE